MDNVCSRLTVHSISNLNSDAIIHVNILNLSFFFLGKLYTPYSANLTSYSQIVIASNTVGSVHTHTLTLVDMAFGDEGKYTCTVVIADGDTPRVLVTELFKLC